MQRQYQKNFSEINRSVLDGKVRIIKAKKIVSVINDFLQKEQKGLQNLVCLDIGGSGGFVAKELSSQAERVFVVDIDKKALDFGKQYNNASNIFYLEGDAMNLPFDDESIDIVICNQVYEHVLDYHKLAQEIYRVLKNNGICYFGAGNRFVLIEQHYRLPFLSWLPKNIANWYLKIARGKPYYYENLLSYCGLINLLKPFKIYDYTVEVIKNPGKYYNTDLIKPNSLLTKMPSLFFRVIKPIIPTYIFILAKE